MNNNQFGKYFKLLPDENDVSFLNIIGPDPCIKDRIIRDREKLKYVIGVYKKEGKKIGYTSGVYDLPHDGHILYLAAAKRLCDLLVLGVDNDDLTRQRKPDEKIRPIDTLEVRLLNLSHNRSVNILTVRTPDEPLEQLVMDILPDVAIFSRSTKDVTNFEETIIKNLGDYCGEIVFFDPMSTNSTTAKIRKLAINGANELALFLKKELDGAVDLNVLERAIEKYFNPQGGHQ